MRLLKRLSMAIMSGREKLYLMNKRKLLQTNFLAVKLKTILAALILMTLHPTKLAGKALSKNVKNYLKTKIIKGIAGTLTIQRIWHTI